MKNSVLKKIFFLIIILSFTITPLFSTAEEKGFTPLSGSDFKQELGVGEGKVPDFKTFVNKAFQIGVRVAGVLAVLVIILGGLEYMTSDAISGKSEGKEKIKRAVLGLVIVLSSILILNTINPNIAKFTFNLEGQKSDAPAFQITDSFQFLNEYETLSEQMQSDISEDEYNKLNEAERKALLEKIHPPSDNIVSLDPSITIKPGASSGANAQLASKLNSLNEALSDENISWRVTEGYPPTPKVKHSNPCHYNGNCVDANFIGTPSTADNIKTFIHEAEIRNLKAVYEVKTVEEKNRLISQGVPSGNIISLGRITASHFSVYNN